SAVGDASRKSFKGRSAANGRPLIRTRVVNRLWVMAIGVPPQARPQDRRTLPVGDDYGSTGRSEWLDIDWQEHLRQVQVHGSRVNYVELGEGPPLVLIHGLAGCWQNWLEHISAPANRRS